MRDQQDILINDTIIYVKNELKNAEGGHDWWHILRVWNTSKHIADQENCCRLVVELGALLHDIADSKFHNGDDTIGPEKTRQFLQVKDVETSVIDHVVKIVENISFKGGNLPRKFTSIELDIVQDADRLDAIGAIGIARAFNYGGFKNREIHNPGIQPKINMTPEEYKSNKGPTINHFYEKLLTLRERMNTKTGKFLADERHRFMELYLEQFYREWSGKPSRKT
ncbi:HD domain-containing protein [Membranihabitans maritimus]|uniref:HD domain-containing protein n=1 Tax=Membranihabitans maritimus TaxID=2904244 RepID=UPI001F1DE0F8|nr:HD domain-containing protein [Membranihabitans maritimus]